MQTRMWHIILVLMFAIVFIGALSVGLSDRSAQALSAPPPIGPQTPIGLVSVAPLGLPGAPEGVCSASAIPTYTLLVTATQDAYVNQAFPSTNYGTADLHVGTWNGNIRRSLVQFDLSALPANAVVVSATMELYWIVNLANAPQATQAITPQVEAILAAWGESTVNWTNQPLAESRGDPAYSLVYPGYNKFDVTQIAQAWKSGAVINNGIRVRNDSDTTYHSFESRHNTHKPRLTIVYHTCAKPLTSVTVSGPTLGVTNTVYTFNSLLSPLDATTPITYRWTATNYTCGLRPNPPCPTGASGTFTWTVLGTQTVTLTAKNCSGETFTATHTITMSNPAASLPVSRDQPDAERADDGHHRHELCLYGDYVQDPHLSGDVYLAGQRSRDDDASCVIDPILPGAEMEFRWHQVDHRDGAKLRRRGHCQSRGQYCGRSPVTRSCHDQCVVRR